jgi:hypothetical protein
MCEADVVGVRAVAADLKQGRGGGGAGARPRWSWNNDSEVARFRGGARDHDQGMLGRNEASVRSGWYRDHGDGGRCMLETAQ